MKIVTITIDEEGDQTVDLTGYHGKGCDAVADVFGRALGTTTKVVHKPEHNRPLLNMNVVKH
jgi:transposase